MIQNCEIILPQLESTDFEALATAPIFQAFDSFTTKRRKPNAENLTNLVSDDATAEDILADFIDE